jgi:hypothetical protein
MDTARGSAGFASLGAGVIAAPVATMVYVGLAWSSVAAMTACVDASSMMCLAGPLLGTALMFVTTLALGALVAAVAMLLAAGAALIQQRGVYLAATFGLGAVLIPSGALFLFRASGVRTLGLESEELEPGLIALAIGAPLVAVGLACWVAGAVRALTAAVVSATAPPGSGKA